MAAQYELLKELLNGGTKLSFGQEFFFKFYQAFILKDRWLQYVSGVGTTLLVTALALALGIVLGSVVALVRVAHDQQRPGHKNPVLGGALGNLVDRIRFRAVIDFVDVYVGQWHWPAFNVADMAICVGAFLACIVIWRTPEAPEKSKEKKS